MITENVADKSLMKSGITRVVNALEENPLTFFARGKKRFSRRAAKNAEKRKRQPGQITKNYG
jgi:hypothetical protein